MKRLIIIPLLFVLLHGQNTSDLRVDTFVYRSIENVFLTDLLIAFKPAVGQSAKNDTIDVSLIVYEDSLLKQVLATNHYFLRNQKSNKGNTDNYYLDIFTLDLPPGNYLYRIKTSILGQTEFAKAEASFEVPALTDDRSKNSSLLLSDKIGSSGTIQTGFERNNLYIQPNPTKRFSKTKNKIYFYLELYDSQLFNKNCYVTITNSSGDTNLQIQKKPKIIDESLALLIGGFNLLDFETGQYKLSVYPNEDIKETLSESEFYFIDYDEVSNSDKQFSRKENILPEYNMMSLAELNEEIKYLQHIIKKDSYKMLKESDSAAEKRIFLSRFWRQNDTNKETETLEFKRYYFTLIDYVKLNLSGFRDDPFDTDMARIILTYGIPDIKTKIVDDESGRNIEYWQFNKLAGSYCLFVQFNYIGPYRLIHSTIRGELSDPEWESYVKNNYEKIY
jgi:GWxTD domain-containing protein